MKIVFLLPGVNLSGGVRVVAIHARNLLDRGHHVELIAPPPRQASFFSRMRQFLRSGRMPRRYRHDLAHTDALNLTVRILETYRPIAAADVPDADVVIGTWWETVEWMTAFPPEKGRKVHLVQDHETFEPMPQDRVAAVYRQAIPKLVVSEWLANLIRNEYGQDEVMLVPNAVEQEKFLTVERDKQSDPTFGFLWNPSPRKNIQLVVAALGEARAKVPNLKVICFGTGIPAGENALPDWFDYHRKPAHAKIAEIYAGCDAWLFPSITEGFGLPIVEAMASRTPVIGTSAGAAPDYVNEQTGALVEGTVEAFADQIVRFSRMSNEQWKALSGAAHCRVSRYGWKDATNLFEAALERTAGKDTV
jgi:glycosyltransferase involved in cell wall biosynthesis